jgi:cytochrome c biogenesis protein CcdA
MNKRGLKRLQKLQRELLKEIEVVRQMRNGTPKTMEINEFHRQKASLSDAQARVEREIAQDYFRYLFALYSLYWSPCARPLLSSLVLGKRSRVSGAHS